MICGQAPAAAMRAAVERLMERLQLPVNATKTRSLRVPEEPMKFLGYHVGHNDDPCAGAAYIGTRPSQASVRSTSQDQCADGSAELRGASNKLIRQWRPCRDDDCQAPRWSPSLMILRHHNVQECLCRKLNKRLDW